MICPKCGQDTPIQKSFCVNCGGLLETDFGSVQEAVGMEVRDEARSALIRRSGAWLAVSIVLLAGALAFRLANREKDLPRFDESPVFQILDLESPQPYPELEMPELALPVPAP